VERTILARPSDLQNDGHNYGAVENHRAHNIRLLAVHIGGGEDGGGGCGNCEKSHTHKQKKLFHDFPLFVSPAP